ncbi:MAG: 4'-phosphopantetheinyl transferase superfamily protein [Deltaproteobacteria bacterium]|nr:4'-phosphopantetheinyl transferase superfamily protein [Deltaproteobacteria bacterium]
MIDWLLARSATGLEAGWLHPQERREARRFCDPRRRGQYLLGRHAAKQLIAARARRLGQKAPAPCALRIERTGAGWPRALGADGEPLNLCLSISHSGDLALVAIDASADGAIGADCERVEPRSASFSADYFTARERALIAGIDPAIGASLLWCLKEAALKALRCGLRRDTRTVELRALGSTGADGWRPAEIALAEGGTLEARWRLLDRGRLCAALARAGAQAPRSSST